MAYDPNEEKAPETGSAQDPCGAIHKQLIDMEIPPPIAGALMLLIKSLTKDGQPKPKTLDTAFKGMHGQLKLKTKEDDNGSS